MRSILVAAVAAVSALGFASPDVEPPRAATLTVASSQAYLPRANGGARDDYRCFLLDPKLDRDVFLTRATFLPGVAPIVHHIILFRVPPERVAEARALDARVRGPGWGCFGGTGLDELSVAGLEDASWVAAWAPSRSKDRLPDGLGVPLQRGTQLVMQVHYSLYATPRPDRTRAVLTLVPQDGSSIRPLRTILLPAPIELPCLPEERGPLCDRTAALADLVRRHGLQAGIVPPGLLAFCGRDPAAPQPSTVSTCDMRFDRPATIQAAAGHMHLRGKTFSLELNPGTPQARTIVTIPRWDFHNQRIYVLSPPVPVTTRDTLRVTCEFDQRLRRQYHHSGLMTPRYVLWGEGTGDEMCVGILQVTND